MEAKPRAAMLPRLSKVGSIPMLNLLPLNNEKGVLNEGKSIELINKMNKSMSVASHLFEEYKPRGADHYDSTLQDPNERKQTLKKAHLASLKTKLHKSFQMSQDLTKAIDLSMSASSLKDSELEIDKLLLKTRNDILKFKEPKLDLRRERMLRAQGAKNKTGGKEVKTLIHAILNRLPQLVKPMLKDCQSNAEKMQMITVCDQFERTALHYASFLGQLNVCEKLVAAGANPGRKDCMLRTPVHYAVLGSHEQVLEVLVRQRSQQEKKELIPPTPPHHSSMAMKRPKVIPEAVFLSSTDLIEFAPILQDMDGLTTDPVTPSFHPNQVVDDTKIIDSQDQFFRTPMHYAAMKEKYSTIKLLCSLGANLDLEDCHRKRPVDCTDHQAIKKFLVSHTRINKAQGEAQ